MFVQPIRWLVSTGGWDEVLAAECVVLMLMLLLVWIFVLGLLDGDNQPYFMLFVPYSGTA